MLRHLLKLTWKRKSRNLLLSMEILLAFVIVFAIAATAVRYWQLYHAPLGFRYDDVWAIQLQPPNEDHSARAEGVHLRMVQALQAMPEVESAALTNFALFQSARMTSHFSAPGGKQGVRASMLQCGDQFWSTLGMQLLAGRWPSEQDNGSAALPAVLNRKMADALFPGRSPLGQEVVSESHDPKDTQRFRVVGLIEDFRSEGEFMTPQPFILFRHTELPENRMRMAILAKVRPGTPRAFEATLQRQLKQVRNDWSYQVNPESELRASQMVLQLVPLKILAVIGAFLLAMVAFGLFGVLWQNTTRRIPEIGLRRAMGATAGSIYRQIVGEQLLLSSLAMLGGLVLLVQLPLTGALGDSLDWRVFGAAAALSMAVIYLLSLLCSLYPGWRASRLHPAAALHYE